VPLPAPTAATHAKWAYTTRRVDRRAVHHLLPAAQATQAGQLVLAQITRLGQHDGLQLASGRRAELYLGDRVVLCLGDRYAPDQFEGIAQVGADGRCELLAAGGVAGTVRHRHGRMKPATELKLLACLGDVAGRPLDVAQAALPLRSAERITMPVVLVVGSSMNAGKTTACASLIHGLSRAGLHVGAAKITGTGSFGDVQSYADAGADEVLDFTDAGYASTYRVDIPALERAARGLIGELQARRCEVAVVEIADGLFQRETAELLASPWIAAAARGVVYASVDAMGAVAGVQRLQARGWPVLALTGLVTASPLAAAEASAALAALDAPVPCYTRDALRDPATVTAWPRLALPRGLAQAA